MDRSFINTLNVKYFNIKCNVIKLNLTHREIIMEEKIEKINGRLDKMESKMEDNKTKIHELENVATACKLGCELPSYKKEMKQRCEKFDSKIDSNTEMYKSEKQNILDKIRDLSEEFEYKFKQSRVLIGRVISSSVVFAVALIGIFGTIQVNKVSQAEFNNHLRSYHEDKQQQIEKFDNFVSTYTFDREKRDEKIDNMFQKQIDFNQEIVKQNGLLQQQLEVLKTKMSLEK